MEQLKTDHHLSSVKSIGKTFKNFENKNIAYLLLFVVVSNHSVYVVFLDSHQAIDDSAFFLPTSKKLMWRSGRDKYENILALHIL